MSLDPILWALKDAPVADVYERAVLTILAEAADDDGCDAFPAVSTMAERAMCSPRQVSRVIQELLSRGMIGLGNQDAATYIPPRYRPVVYDVLIPYEWFSNPTRINAFRGKKGRDPLTPESRPAISIPPEKPRRADHGKPKPRKKPKAPAGQAANSDPEPAPVGPLPSRVDYQSPLDESPAQTGMTSSPPSPGVTASPARDDYQSKSGVTGSHTNHPLTTNLPLNLPTGGPPPEPPAPAATASGPNSERARRKRPPSKPKSQGDHQRAARERAGTAAVNAINANPDIPLNELRRLISDDNPRLYPAQVAGRAATLAASWPARTTGLAEECTEPVNESETSVLTEFTDSVKRCMDAGGAGSGLGLDESGFGGQLGIADRPAGVGGGLGSVPAGDVSPGANVGRVAAGAGVGA